MPELIDGLASRQKAISTRLLKAAGIKLEASATDPSVQRFLETASVDELARMRLVTLLERHEWNIARVAREEHVSRKTVYAQLDRFGIDRKKTKRSYYYWAGKARQGSRGGAFSAEWSEFERWRVARAQAGQQDQPR